MTDMLPIAVLQQIHAKGRLQILARHQIHTTGVTTGMAVQIQIDTEVIVQVDRFLNSRNLIS